MARHRDSEHSPNPVSCRIASILVSHFLLNLRRVQHATESASMPSLRIPTLPDLVSSFGGPVQPDFIENRAPAEGTEPREKWEFQSSGEESGETTPYSASLNLDGGSGGSTMSCGLHSETVSLAV